MVRAVKHFPTSLRNSSFACALRSCSCPIRRSTKSFSNPRSESLTSPVSRMNSRNPAWNVTFSGEEGRVRLNVPKVHFIHSFFLIRFLSERLCWSLSHHTKVRNTLWTGHLSTPSHTDMEETGPRWQCQPLKDRVTNY